MTIPIRYLLPAALFLAALSWSVSAQVPGIPEQVRLDLSSHDFSSHPVVNLAGTWGFTPAVGYGPEDLDGIKWSAVEVPGSWPKDAVAPGFDYPFGVGTYRLELLLPQDHPPLILRLELVMSSFRLTANGQVLEDFLILDPDKERKLPINTSKYYLLPPHNGRLELVLEVSNFWDRYNTGFCLAPKIGVWRSVHDERLLAVAGETFLAGLLLIAAVYHLLLYFIQRKDLALLYFALICSGVLVRQLSTNEAYWLYSVGTSLPLFLKLQLGTIWFICISFLFYLKEVFPDKTFRIPLFVLTVYAVAGLILNLILPMRQFTALLPSIHLCIGVTIVYGLAVILRAIHRREPQAFLMLAATLSISIPVMLDMYKTAGQSLNR